MSRIAPIHWKKLECVLLSAGFKFARQNGSHRIYVKEGVRPVVIPVHNTLIDPFVIQNHLRSAKMSRDDYFRYWEEC